MNDSRAARLDYRKDAEAATAGMMYDMPVPQWHHLPENRFNPHAWIVGSPVIGEGTWIGAFTVIDGSGGLEIGHGCDISAGAQIYSHSTVRRALSEHEAPIDRAATRIGDWVHVGAGAVILMGCEIGSHSVVAAGSVVRQGTVAPEWSVLRGVPARVHPEAAHHLMARPHESAD